MSEEAVKKLQKVVERLEAIVVEGQEVLVRIGHTLGEIREAGEEEHLMRLSREGGELWVSAIRPAAEIRKAKRIRQRALRQAYASKGLFGFNQNGAFMVANSLMTGSVKTFENYFPIQHLAGMASAIQYILDK